MLIKSRALRRLAVLGATAALAGALGTASASATAIPNSSGGGCSGYVGVGNGLSIKSCIAASNWVLYPDGYISGSAGNCYLHVTLLDSNYSIVTDRTSPCSSGHVLGENTSNVVLGAAATSLKSTP
ncbi:hypothetical protein E6W39_19785 [Kitasatospora acidiphila]|uniref:Secreted protein n=1 Tax=Kitasatospora acidiphila TaxID=2567942 RepID=A0A540W4U5_9ACTN|nr:hypothetical protein [Kitasatospora acidiphila]TQF04061.1 hypothetical protein E6W39_19785 [Kitasatospora acidiphila]